MINQRMISCHLSIFFGVLLFLHADLSAADNWPQFRGSGSLGIAEGQNLPDKWSADENVAWKTDIPGRGWSSPVVWGDRIFVTSVVNQGESEKPKKGLYFGGNRSKPSKDPHQWNVHCLDLKTGKKLWKKTVHKGPPQTPMHLKNSYASETPVTDGKYLYAYFGNIGVFCFDLEGKMIWSKKFDPVKYRFDWGSAASPVLHQDRIYIVNDNEDQSWLLALNKKTGEEIWKIERDERSNWATPYIWKNELRTEIITPGTKRVRSYDLDGNLLWELSGMSSIVIGTPFSHDGLLYVSSGYVLDNKKPIFVIKPGAKGDISLSKKQTSNEFIVWSQKKAGPYNPTTLIYEDRLFVLLDRGLAACFDAKTGKPIYKKHRLPKGRAFTSSPWAYDGKIFCLNEDGVTFVLESGDEFKILHTNKLAEDDMCMATPAIAGDRLLIRTATRIYCIKK